jgi:hypothetical protein
MGSLLLRELFESVTETTVIAGVVGGSETTSWPAVVSSTVAPSSVVLLFGTKLLSVVTLAEESRALTSKASD